MSLRIETLAPAVIHWSDDDWNSVHDATTRDTGLSIHLADMPTASLPAGREVKFTFYWSEAKRWEGADFVVGIGTTEV